MRDTLTLGRFFKVGGTNGCLCYELWLLIGANLMNAGCCVETDALCNVADFSGCASLSIAGTSRRGNIWQVTKLCGEKGKPKKKKKCKQLFVYFFVNLWVTVCMCTLVCVLSVRVSSSQALVYLFEPSLLFWLSCLASYVALN